MTTLQAAERPSVLNAVSDMPSDERREFQAFALGWFGQASPDEARRCLENYRRMKAEGVKA
ncbi:hypothetical protein [Sphingopyxis sp. 113P3]|uniref:hypothetical protein n=1 Tax=Sphingopyxis sp. (strain 113P3) TaxID=292913 RepID=UPI0006AD21A4|nr:hypothetical protein [Sphingopyxis sp. 113P3]ALC12514.1 hypothetical protein LH20_11180 [Sphingopyxis sp. 113P3]